MFLAPGRIGTKSPELGLPVSFAEISNIKVICEVSYKMQIICLNCPLALTFFTTLWNPVFFMPQFLMIIIQ